MNNNGFWGKDDFELTVAKALIALSEKKHISNKKIDRTVRVGSKEILRLKQFGLYFPAPDRIVEAGVIDIRNDGLPEISAVTSQSIFQKDVKTKYNSDEMIDGYLAMYWMARMQLGKHWVKTGCGIPYAVYSAYAREEGGIIWGRDFITIDSKTGDIYPAERHIQYNNGFSHKTEIIKAEQRDEKPVVCYQAAACVGFYQDRLSLWNVAAVEGKVKATFGVYKEQIQSLFYARDLPKTKTGRKSPILHWVASHKRRIKAGIEIDIKKHLRGTNKFEMDGTTFEISFPDKKRQL